MNKIFCLILLSNRCRRRFFSYFLLPHRELLVRIEIKKVWNGCDAKNYFSNNRWLWICDISLVSSTLLYSLHSFRKLFPKRENTKKKIKKILNALNFWNVNIFYNFLLFDLTHLKNHRNLMDRKVILKFIVLLKILRLNLKKKEFSKNWLHLFCSVFFWFYLYLLWIRLKLLKKHWFHF